MAIHNDSHPAFCRVGECHDIWPNDLKYRHGFQEWVAGARVDMWFHATDNDQPFSIFCKSDEGSIGFHAGTLEAALHRHRQIYRVIGQERAQNEGYILPLLIRYTKAFEMDDQYDWRLDKITGQLIERDILSEQEEDWILGRCDTQSIFGALERAGYDAILYPNECEGRKGDTSIITWRAENIKSANAASFKAGSPLLCPTLVPSEWEWRAWEENTWEIEQWLSNDLIAA